MKTASDAKISDPQDHINVMKPKVKQNFVNNVIDDEYGGLEQGANSVEAGATKRKFLREVEISKTSAVAAARC